MLRRLLPFVFVFVFVAVAVAVLLFLLLFHSHPLFCDFLRSFEPPAHLIDMHQDEIDPSCLFFHPFGLDAMDWTYGS